MGESYTVSAFKKPPCWAGYHIVHLPSSHPPANLYFLSSFLSIFLPLSFRSCCALLLPFFTCDESGQVKEWKKLLFLFFFLLLYKRN